MPRTAITVNTLAATGVDPLPTAGDSTNNHTYAWSANRMLMVRNGGGSSITVTIAVNATVDGLTVPSRTVTVAAAATRAIDTRNAAYCQTDGSCSVDLSASATVTVGVLDVPRLPA